MSLAAEPLPWPSALEGTPTVAVIERAIERKRLAHSLLLHGENLSTLASVAHAIADRLLNDPRDKTQYFAPKTIPTSSRCAPRANPARFPPRSRARSSAASRFPRRFRSARSSSFTRRTG